MLLCCRETISAKIVNTIHAFEPLLWHSRRYRCLHDRLVCANADPASDFFFAEAFGLRNAFAAFVAILHEVCFVFRAIVDPFCLLPTTTGRGFTQCLGAGLPHASRTHRRASPPLYGVR
jgi:hypothetical protein